MASELVLRAASMMRSMWRYEGPIATASSLPRACGASRSASENTAIGEIPMDRQVSAMRMAISPRFAIRSFRIGNELLYCRLSADLLENHVERSLRTCADAKIVGQIHPANNSGRVNEEFGGPRDVVAVG